MERLHKLSENVIALVAEGKYRAAAIKAVQSGSMRVYIGALLNEQSVDQFFDDMAAMESFGNTGGEPCYPSVELANQGYNEDGTPHGGYLVIDVVERVVVDLINTDGTTRLQTPLVRFATTDKVVV
jgi:hypothetical protein